MTVNMAPCSSIAKPVLVPLRCRLLSLLVVGTKDVLKDGTVALNASTFAGFFFYFKLATLLALGRFPESIWAF